MSDVGVCHGSDAVVDSARITLYVGDCWRDVGSMRELDAAKSETVCRPYALSQPLVFQVAYDATISGGVFLRAVGVKTVSSSDYRLCHHRADVLT